MVVIVILGILAVTAAPRFLNLQDDARASSLQGLKGAIDGAAGIVYGKSAFEGEEAVSAAGGAEVEGITTAFGYPTADDAGIGAAVTGLTTDWSRSTTNGVMTLTFAGASAAPASDCIVTYTQATGPTAASAASTAVTLGAGCNGN